MLIVVATTSTGLMPNAALQSISGERYFVLDILTGVWAIGIYLLMRSYFQSFPSAVAGTVIAWWVIQSLITIKGGGADYSFAQASVVSFVSFVSICLSVLAGTWPYEKLKSNNDLFALLNRKQKSN